MFTSLVPQIQKRRVSMLIALLALGAVALMATGCTRQDSGQAATLEVTPNADGTIHVVIANAHTTIGVSRMSLYWTDKSNTPVYEKEYKNEATYECRKDKVPGIGPTSGPLTMNIPARSAGGSLVLHVWGSQYQNNVTTSYPCASLYDYEGWSNEVVVPAAQAAAVGVVAAGATNLPIPAKPTAVLFAHALPADMEGGTLVDARESTGSGQLTYEWSQGCGSAQYGPMSGHDEGSAVPTGTRWANSAGIPASCTVTVKDLNGSTASEALSLTKAAVKNSNFDFDITQVVGAPKKVGIVTSDYTAATACVDPTGGSNFTVKVLLDQQAGSFEQSLLSQGAGLHRVTAAIWGMSNPDCDDHTATGALQVITDLYTVDSAGAIAARRGMRSSLFIAPSSLRFVSSKTISEGTSEANSSTIKGAMTSGSFTWSMPKSAKGVKRPAGATKLARGAYVMRSIDMMAGPMVGTASTLLGTGTVLLRGTDGTLACGTLAGGFDSSTLTLTGGTRSARTLAGNVTGKRVTYVFPTSSAAAAKRSGGVSGVLETALGWLTGDQPSDRAKKPSKKPTKPKPVKVKPVRASGTASLQTAAKPTALPAACKALVRYLPQ